MQSKNAWRYWSNGFGKFLQDEIAVEIDRKIISKIKEKLCTQSQPSDDT